MKIEESIYESKHGKKIILRSSSLSDSKELLENLVRCAGETDYLGRYPEEINGTVEEETSYISKLLEDEKGFDISAFVDNKLVGNATISCIRETIKAKHRAGYGICVSKDYWNMGIGDLLTTSCLNYAKKLGYDQVELEVAADNERAVHVYEQKGFKVCGTIVNGEKRKDGTYRDLLLMICRL